MSIRDFFRDALSGAAEGVRERMIERVAGKREYEPIAETAPLEPRRLQETPLEQMTRRASEYFSVITRMERQRDEWKDLFKEQSSQHQNAQALLENALMVTREAFQKAMWTLNKYRTDKGEPPYEIPRDIEKLDSHPIGTAAAFGERMAILEGATEPLLDGKAERDKID